MLRCRWGCAEVTQREPHAKRLPGSDVRSFPAKRCGDQRLELRIEVERERKMLDDAVPVCKRELMIEAVCIAAFRDENVRKRVVDLINERRVREGRVGRKAASPPQCSFDPAV